MRPSVSRLLSWQPGQLGEAGQALLARAADLQRSAGELSSIGSGLSGVWSGAAAQAATAHHTRRAGEVDELAIVVHRAGQALLRAADAVAQSLASLRSALAAAAAAGCTVLDDGSVLPPARPPVPAGLDEQERTAWQDRADATAAAQAAGAARLERQIRAALDAAGHADDTSAAALHALEPPAISPAPQPVVMGLTGGQWGPTALPSCPVTLPTSQVPAGQDDGHWWDGAWEDIAGFARATGEQLAEVPGGVRDGVVEPARMIGGLIGLNGDVTDNWSDLGQGLRHGAANPTEFGQALIGWDDLSAGRYGHWAGELLPGAAAAFVTGGAAAGVKGADAAAATARAGRALRGGRTGVDDVRAPEPARRPPARGGTPGGRPLPDLSDITHVKGTDEWAREVSGRYPALTPDEAKGVYDYTTNAGYDAMNRQLRSGANDPAVQSRIDAAVAGLGKLPPVPGTTFRGTHLPDEVVDAWRPGATVSDRAFLSTSTDEGVARSFGDMEIVVHGRSGVDVHQLSHYGREGEILFKPGQEFEVLRRDFDAVSGRWSFELREVP